jgi:hypothetical protein
VPTVGGRLSNQGDTIALVFRTSFSSVRRRRRITDNGPTCRAPYGQIDERAAKRHIAIFGMLLSFFETRPCIAVKMVDQACRVCQTIGIAQRRLRYELGRIDRWRKEPLRFPCSLQKSSKTAWTLQQKIFDLQQTRVSVKLAHRKGIQAQSLGAGQATTLVFQQI